MKESGWQLNDGAKVVPGRGVSFRVWAPRARAVAVHLLGRAAVPMKKVKDGYFQVEVKEANPGDEYVYVLDGELERPDPVSRRQPRGVHGPSGVLDPSSFQWDDDDWRGLPLEQYILYEIHTGAFTLEGTFEGILSKLPYLKRLGITAIELMPAASFPGERNWGYDGVGLYAPQESYGGPLGLKILVNACHLQGIAVVLDVVYNHLGPEGNYLADFGPYFTDRYKTPWGEAINYDEAYSDQVRQFVIDNALYWLTEYHIDALRLDAVHAIFDFSACHILEQLQYAFREQARCLGRKAYLIAESDLNDARLLSPKEKGGYHLDAQWNDEFHHALHTLLTKNSKGYFADFGKIFHLQKAMTEGFVYDGQWSAYRKRHFGSSSKHLPGEKFVVFIQNHDQIANACRGSTLATLVTTDQLKTAAYLLFFSPNIPLIFMGQEWGSQSPFYFFTSFTDSALAAAVSEGRKKEYASHGIAENFHDPQSIDTFHASKLDWSWENDSKHMQIFQLYQKLIELKKQNLALVSCNKDSLDFHYDEKQKWCCLVYSEPQEKIALAVNLSRSPQQIGQLPGYPQLEGETMSPWSVQLWTGSFRVEGDWK
ncbi:MAG: malto-oligosyltrehalose trehalohydrolase [Waddliaceae bacterium]